MPFSTQISFKDDTWVKYYFIPLIAVFSSNVGLELYELSSFMPLANSLWAVVISYGGWYIFKSIFFYYAQLNSLKNRFIRQLSTSLIAISFYLALMDFIFVSLIWKTDWPVNSDFLQVELPLSWVWLIVLQLIYTMMLNRQEKSFSAPVPSDDMLPVFVGKKAYQLPVSEIAYIFIKDKLSLLISNDGRRFMMDASLNQLEARLPPTFFRANRQLIVSRRAVASYQSLPNRKLLLRLQPENLPDQTIGKMKITQFKEWLCQ